MRTIDQFSFCNQKVIIRVDFNVPIDKNTVADTSRIEAAKQTIDKICLDGGSCILVSHLGRPNGFQDEFSMKKIIDSVKKVLKKKVLLSNDVIGKDSILKASNLKPGEVLLLENVRFHKEETEGDLNFAKQLSRLGDCYVNDAFGTAHRAHASTTIISKFFTNKFFGKLLEKEVLAINKVMSSGQKPVLAILGGAKISSKIPILKNIIKIVDDVIIGGGMSFTFSKALGGNIGKSICEDSMLDICKDILKSAEKNNVKIHLPLDAIWSLDFNTIQAVKF